MNKLDDSISDIDYQLLDKLSFFLVIYYRSWRDKAHRIFFNLYLPYTFPPMVAISSQIF